MESAQLSLSPYLLPATIVTTGVQQNAMASFKLFDQWHWVHKHY